MPNIHVKLTRGENAEYFGKLVGSIVTMDMETYLMGVVPAEVGNAPQECCKAQAVAARTYALPYVHSGASISDASSVAQAYRAPRAVNTAYTNAHEGVRQTAGEVLHYGGKLLATCSYSASNGGRTTSSEERWGGYRPYLIAQDDPWDYAATGGKKTGHGVGMSQAGAAFAADKLEKSYFDILAFYYVGAVVVDQYGEGKLVTDAVADKTQIGGTNMIRVKDLCDYARNAVNGGYCWGSSGETCSQKYRQELANRAPDQANNLLGVCAKWDGRKVWDCSGLFRGAWRALAKYKSGGATTIFKTWCTETGLINAMPDEPGIAVFKGSGSNMSHIGLYVGNGMVVDARGSAKGVLYEPMGAVAWTHWGRLADVDYRSNGCEPLAPTQPNDVLYRAKVVNVKTGLNFRTSPKNAENTILLLKLNTIVEVLEDNVGDGFCRARYGNTVGYCTRSYLMQLD